MSPADEQVLLDLFAALEKQELLDANVLALILQSAIQQRGPLSEETAEIVRATIERVQARQKHSPGTLE